MIDELQAAADAHLWRRVPYLCEQCEKTAIVDATERWPACPNCGHEQTYERTRRLLGAIGVS